MVYKFMQSRMYDRHICKSIYSFFVVIMIVIIKDSHHHHNYHHHYHHHHNNHHRHYCHHNHHDKCYHHDLQKDAGHISEDWEEIVNGYEAKYKDKIRKSDQIGNVKRDPRIRFSIDKHQKIVLTDSLDFDLKTRSYSDLNGLHCHTQHHSTHTPYLHISIYIDMCICLYIIIRIYIFIY
jgi:hypothetical protein